MRLPVLACASIALLFAACRDSQGNLDAGTPAPDALPGSPDAEPPPYDSGTGPEDTGPPRDTGPYDSGVIMQGPVEIHQLSTYIVVEGTLTSTLPPIVFMHMGPGLAHEYLPPLYTYLLPTRLLVFYDQRGEGLSSIGPVGTSSSSAFKTEQRARDAYDLVGWVQATLAPSFSKVDIIAHGYGTVIAAMLAADHPDRVAHLVLSNPYPADIHQVADFDAEALARLTDGERQNYYVLLDEPQCRGNVNMCSIELWNLKGPHWLCAQNMSMFSQLFFMNGDFRNQNFIEFYLREELYDLRPKLAQITTPSTIISGPCEPTPARTAHTYTASIAGAHGFVLDGTGYFPQLEQPDEYRRLVLHGLAL